mmetsp:Transcript_90697/g.270707  ORF Transcript_90697/g.270707 Transcript_90697/m.270707 type:complete len:236 (-) Transcript_90697:329-1036(-)
MVKEVRVVLRASHPLERHGRRARLRPPVPLDGGQLALIPSPGALLLRSVQRRVRAPPVVLRRVGQADARQFLGQETQVDDQDYAHDRPLGRHCVLHRHLHVVGQVARFPDVAGHPHAAINGAVQDGEADAVLPDGLSRLLQEAARPLCDALPSVGPPHHRLHGDVLRGDRGPAGQVCLHSRYDVVVRHGHDDCRVRRHLPHQHHWQGPRLCCGLPGDWALRPAIGYHQQRFRGGP